MTDPARPDRLVLPERVSDAVLTHASDGAPHEICGVLAGRRGDDADRVVAHHPIQNVAVEPRTRYELDPAETVTTIERIEAAGNEVVGFYHSHPRGPHQPSDTDRAQATWTGYVYAIAVPGEGVRAWRWTGETFAPLDVVHD